MYWIITALPTDTWQQEQVDYLLNKNGYININIWDANKKRYPWKSN